MKSLLACVIGVLLISSAGVAQRPTITATVTPAKDSVTYTYTLTNTSAYDIWQFVIFMPAGAADTIASHSTSMDGWFTLIREAAFDMIGWDWNHTSVIAPGYDAEFSFVTYAGVGTTTTYAVGSISNWGWCYGVPDAGTVDIGDTILPVPIPEPSSLLALLTGLAGLGAVLRTRSRGDLEVR